MTRGGYNAGNTPSGSVIKTSVKPNKETVIDVIRRKTCKVDDNILTKKTKPIINRRWLNPLRQIRRKARNEIVTSDNPVRSLAQRRNENRLVISSGLMRNKKPRTCGITIAKNALPRITNIPGLPGLGIIDGHKNPLLKTKN
jgi:hypothetical protein